ncbi:3-hydroxyisobutyryl-CoA hydrolase, mitochondrial [Hondaea fermentalgiana]|uniref:3-hydroxyisobutyryl-CoA hydrolase n=1 Tax=Hondaea fermentalgiana TaxID=2315210 RepID=A0A2R5H192_9STRA|nr:3-hydroxyisobutyryl-CoA hydrolase, mitochondrial [Hondaea fermentalgiana]|eukprot:GBG34561.1 3-hydroxyisobutyryl-CoA hydrolase, mitochondrial [Hondaea fermentalgiana]
MIKPLQTWFATWRDAEPAQRPRCILLTGEGKAFCAGGDVVTARTSALSGPGGREHADFFYEEYRLNALIGEMAQPGPNGVDQVSVWDGVTMGGGVGLSIHGRYRVATEKTVFAMPEGGIGFLPDVGATFALPRLPVGPEVGLYIALTGARLGAADCLWAGIATHAMRAEKLPELREALVRSASTGTSVQAVLDALPSWDGPSPSSSSLAANAADLRRIFKLNQPSISSICTALRETKTPWAEQTLALLDARSPTSLALTLRAFQLNARPHVTLFDALVAEYRVVQCLVRDTRSDFFEGVRAVLVDKDNKPRWNDRVPSADQIDAYFASPLPDDHLGGDLRPLPTKTRASL